MCAFCEITLLSYDIFKYLVYRTEKYVNVKKANCLVVSFAPQRPCAFAFKMDPSYDRKGGPEPPSKDNSAPLHYSLYAQLMEGLSSPFFLKGISRVINSGCKTVLKSAEVV